MAVTTTTRIGVTQWSVGTDQPTRAQFNASFLAIETLSAIYSQGVVGSRPSFGVTGRFYWGTDTGLLYYDNGSSWTNVNTLITLSSTDTFTNKTLTNPKLTASGSIADTNGNEWIKIPALVASAVNEITISNSATGNSPSVSATGDDSNLDLLLVSKGTGKVKANAVEVVDLTSSQTMTNKILTNPNITASGALNDTNGNELIKFPALVASAVNEITITNTATGVAPSITASGGDANIDLNLISKGTGKVKANSVEVVDLTTTQTISNKTFVAPVLGAATATSINGSTIPTSKTLVVTTDTLAVHASTTSAQLLGIISDETGSGLLVFNNTPTLITPVLGVATATSINGTSIPTSKTLVVTTDTLAVHAATTSAQLLGVITDETGTGSLVFANTPTLITPALGVATATSINGTTIPTSKTLVVTTDTLAVHASTTSAQLAGIISDETGVGGVLVFNLNPILISPKDKVTNSATAATGTINFDVITQGILNYTLNASANWVMNIRGNSGTTLNSVMAVDEAITAVFRVPQGATAYYPTALTIDGNSVTPKWLGGTAPTAGDVSSVNYYTYVVIKTAANTYTVDASQSKYA